MCSVVGGDGEVEGLGLGQGQGGLDWLMPDGERY